MRYVLAVAFSVLLVVSASAAGEGDGNQGHSMLLEKYEFRDWGGKCKTAYAVLHIGLDVGKVLEDSYVIVSTHGPEEVAGTIPLSYREVSFTAPPRRPNPIPVRFPLRQTHL